MHPGNNQFLYQMLLALRLERFSRRKGKALKFEMFLGIQ